MCGFAGFLGGNFESSGVLRSVATKMSDAIIHRGPDDAGLWLDGERQIALMHRRLAIVDLSAAGHQPMFSHDKRYVIVFNGEIYNHLDLRAEIEKGDQNFAWKGHSDTETLLAGIERWGIQETVERCIGMFAIAVWDRENKTLTLGRDRLGEKPLYYGWQGSGNSQTFLFGSELKALKQHPLFEGKIDRSALALQLQHNYIPAPYSIYRGIAKLLPGCLLSVSLSNPTPKIWQYWSAGKVAREGMARPFNGNAADAVNDLETLLKHAVNQQMMADVPLGAFLSGGVDSTTVVALMQCQSARPIKTFSIGFHDPQFNEAEHAKAVARHLGTDHTELYVTAEQAMAVIPKLPALYDEPFSDSSQIPTFLVSELAKSKVTVSLSGDAGDELFCGYGRYLTTDRFWNRLSSMPPSVRKIAAKGVTAIPPQLWNVLVSPTKIWMKKNKKNVNVGDKLHKGAEILASESLDGFYLGMNSHWRRQDQVLMGQDEWPNMLSISENDIQGIDGIAKLMALDILTYLPDDILVKVDRAAMGVSLETRVPFLDHRVVEFAWQLPMSLKMRDGQSKWALRQVLYRYVPKDLIERPKMGFAVPIGTWLRGPLRDWAESLLDESRLRKEGFFQPAVIRRKWGEHLSGQRNWQYHLWDVLMFQSWLEHQ